MRAASHSTDEANNTSLPLSGTVAVADADVLSARGLAYRAAAGQAFAALSPLSDYRQAVAA
jgi:hypothetical protein